MENKKLEIYKEDCQFVRYQNDLMWNRFKTAATVEGVILIGLYQLSEKLSVTETRLLFLFGFVLVLTILLIALRDANLQNSYLKRVKDFETNNDIKFDNEYPKYFKGNYLVRFAIITITALNITIIALNWN